MLAKLGKFLVSRLGLIITIIAAQVYLIVALVLGLPKEIYTLLIVFSFFMVLKVVNSNKNQSFIITWVIILLLMPGVGWLAYILFADKKVPKNLRGFNEQTLLNVEDILPLNQDVMNEIRNENTDVYKQFNYIAKNGKYPAYRNTSLDYYPVGEDKFKVMLEDLKQAKTYIFIEYFIVREGIMWDSILDILKEKAAEGVDVRVMYDDAGTIQNLPKGYDDQLRSFGIKVHVFNPLTPLLIVQMNNRDHRKICVVDGKVGFLGGTNLADEYINQFERFGHWKDSAIRLEGEAVWSITVMFLQFWNASLRIEEDISKYNPHYTVPSDGYVAPYSDSPTDGEELGENIHINMINLARDYIWIMTPYFVPSKEMLRCLYLASMNGVDVRLVFPHIPDKWYVHTITKSHYEELIKHGIRVYEYKPGFVHSKNFLSDDNLGLVGSTNIDFRSYYLHFESGGLFYDSKKAVGKLKDDFETTFEKSIEITLEEAQDVKWYVRLVRSIINLFSPLL